MKEHSLLKIGEFARLGQVSVATLRYYDQWSLLKPKELLVPHVKFTCNGPNT